MAKNIRVFGLSGFFSNVAITAVYWNWVCFVLVRWKGTYFWFVVLFYVWEGFCEVRISSFGFLRFFKKRVGILPAVENFYGVWIP
jgi:hypothetical protein